MSELKWFRVKEFMNGDIAVARYDHAIAAIEEARREEREKMRSISKASEEEANTTSPHSTEVTDERQSTSMSWSSTPRITDAGDGGGV